MQTFESDANIGNIKILAVDMDKTLLTDERVLPQGLDERLDKLEKKVSALSALLIGYLAGHFLGLLLF